MFKVAPSSWYINEALRRTCLIFVRCLRCSRCRSKNFSGVRRWPDGDAADSTARDEIALADPSSLEFCMVSGAEPSEIDPGRTDSMVDAVTGGAASFS